jgi:small subunit ribosomal protein S6
MQSAEPPRPKEAIGNVNDYEILLMLDADLPEERHNEIIARARELVEKGGGTWVGHDPWGRRKLAYEIAKKTDGVYHLLQFDADPATLDELTRILKITDGVMRHLATRRIESAHGPGRPGPEPTFEAPSADRTPEYAAANTRSRGVSDNGTPSIDAPDIGAPSIEEEEA